MIKRFIQGVFMWAFNTALFGSMCYGLYLKTQGHISTAWYNVLVLLLVVYTIWQSFIAICMPSGAAIYRREMDELDLSLSTDLTQRIKATRSAVQMGPDVYKETLAKHEKSIRAFANSRYSIRAYGLLVLYCLFWYVAFIIALAAAGFIKSSVYLTFVELVWLCGYGAVTTQLVRAKLMVKTMDAIKQPLPSPVTVMDSRGGVTVHQIGV